MQLTSKVATSCSSSGFSQTSFLVRLNTSSANSDTITTLYSNRESPNTSNRTTITINNISIITLNKKEQYSNWYAWFVEQQTLQLLASHDRIKSQFQVVFWILIWLRHCLRLCLRFLNVNINLYIDLYVNLYINLYLRLTYTLKSHLSRFPLSLASYLILCLPIPKDEPGV